MSKLPVMPFIVDAYLADTTHLTTEEHGAYLLLLFAMWKNKGSLPSDDTSLASYAKMTVRAWRRVKPILLQFFTENGPNIVQKRLQLQYNYAAENKERNIARGRAAANSRWERNQLLKEIPSMPQASSPSMPKAYSEHTPSISRGINGAQPDDSNLRKKDITTTCTVSAGSAPKGVEEYPDIPPALNRLLQTKLMKRTQ